jgi:alpha-amylase
VVAVCFYFQVHQPFRLRRYSVFDVGRTSHYFDEQTNRDVLRRVASKCYLPMNRLLLRQIERHRGRFKVAFSISGTALDQFELYAPEVLASFQELVKTGCVELLAETAFHSLTFVHDRGEFDRQVDAHLDRLDHLFGQRPVVFRNTELIFNNALAGHLAGRGFRAVLAEGADRILGWRSPNFLYTAAGAPGIKVLLKNYRLSDDIAFRFGDRGWREFPLTVEKYGRWVNAVNGGGQVVNLFMDYETFGEHQWPETGIFEFMERLPGEVLAHPDNDFCTPGEVAASCEPVGTVDMHDFVSWADVDRDLSAWLGNAMQRTAADALYSLRGAAYASGDEWLIRDWQRLTTSDHLYYMCTKWFADGDVHKYFNPYDTPYEGYISFMNVLNDLGLRLGVRHGRPARLPQHEAPHEAPHEWAAVAGPAADEPWAADATPEDEEALVAAAD